MIRLDPQTYSGLDRLGRIPLSDSFHLREFLHSEIAVHYGLRNVPDAAHIETAIKAGSKLCTLLLEPLQARFGRIHVRSGYRSRAVNEAGVGKHNCAADNDGLHTWDHPGRKNGMGATACISIPRISRVVLSGQMPYEALAWWMHDNLAEWSHVEFFATPEHSDEVCFNIGWFQTPLKTMTTWRGGPRSLLERMPPAAQRRELSQLLLKSCGI
ncbi:MAG: hypothetical protein QM772_02535 [Ottowia sp.]|uniref:hypothetical protein n=1 Tax=Ottowia sp. TaxID=1898956 RepID=UPI0039E6AF0C